MVDVQAMYNKLVVISRSILNIIAITEPEIQNHK